MKKIDKLILKSVSQ